ncbi:ATP-binding protein [Allorhizobium sp. BGMRC 0089]|uniref:sensor histidine kinase n=1 Tax=Allorhizobium sonneratiae TaxID=2934936 RepID=UPI0020346730|nr:ATP-binding protein [Allorhizobium sonneratiae]MCM2293223.1 ATP-binding protein [Allorhizobium sonneratiae]
MQTFAVPHSPDFSRRNRYGWLQMLVVGLLLAAGCFYGIGLYARQTALAELEKEARSSANLKLAFLRAVLERPRSLPLVLAEDQQVIDALSLKTPEAVDRLNRKLARLVAGTSASVLYVTDASGHAIASSNWQSPQSFVGSDYAFRQYFSRSMAQGAAEYFAFGTVSKVPGLYISRRVGPADKPLGVVVVKSEFQDLENDWQEDQRASLVADQSGVILISSIPAWRFKTLAPLPEARRQSIHDSLQFGDAPLQPLSLTTVARFTDGLRLVRGRLPEMIRKDYLEISQDVPTTNWKFLYLVPTEPAIDAMTREMRLVTVSVLAPIYLLVAFVLWRRHAASLRMARVRANQLELERRVAERTLDLSMARDRLEAEIAGRKETEARLQVVQQELVQANRLAILGQVAAGVAHEINQPVATIRAFAENAEVFLERHDVGMARDNLGAISRLTERIGAITEDLKAFARKGRTAPEPVAVGDAVSGAIELLRSRFAGRLDALVFHAPSQRVLVKANRLRLEQVLINLFQNALEAVEAQPDGKVEVHVEVGDGHVDIVIEDNGPGISRDIRPQLFTPFTTSKEKGLGLGLVISRDIIRDYGGDLTVESGAAGARFTIQLPKASA